MRLYLSGPMTGYEHANFPAFFEAARFLEVDGFEVVNPAQMDKDAGLDPDNDVMSVEQYHDALARDMRAVMDCDGICLLPGWKDSTGAKAEHALAQALGHTVYYFIGTEAVEQKPVKLYDDTTTMVTDATTGGMKGVKKAQLGAYDPLALLRIAEVAGFGAMKYDRYNFLKGYAWSSSFDAMMRHLLAFWSGQNNDPESGMPHTAHAAFHCLALISFAERGLGTDDRPKP